MHSDSPSKRPTMKLRINNLCIFLNSKIWLIKCSIASTQRALHEELSIQSLKYGQLFESFPNHKDIKK